MDLRVRYKGIPQQHWVRLRLMQRLDSTAESRRRRDPLGTSRGKIKLHDRSLRKVEESKDGSNNPSKWPIRRVVTNTLYYRCQGRRGRNLKTNEQRAHELLSLIHISEPTRLLSISYAV